MNARARLIQRLEDERARRDWSHAQLARHVGKTPSWLSEIRRGKIGAFLDTLDEVAGLLKIDVQDLFAPHGAKLLAPDTSAVDTAQPLPNSPLEDLPVPERQHEVLYLYHLLPDEDRDAIIEDLRARLMASWAHSSQGKDRAARS